MRSRGSVLLTALILLGLVAGLAAALFAVAAAHARATGRATSALQALYTAEAGAAFCVEDLGRGGAGILSGEYGNGSFAVRLAPRGDLTELVSEGVHGGIRRAVELVLRRGPGDRLEVVSWRSLP